MIHPEPRKRCRICQKPKPLAEFYACRGTKDGHRSECRACFRKMVDRSETRRGIKKKRLAQKRAWYYAHRDYFVKYKRRYHREHREEIKAYFKQYYDEHIEYFRRKKREYRSDKKKLARMKAYNKEWWRRKRARAKREKKQAAR